MAAGTMEFATGAFGSLLPKLANLLHGEYKLQRDVRKNIEFVTKELETMQAALRNVGEVPLEQLPDLDRIWARDARELSYDMEDVVDNFLVHIVGPDPPSKRKWKEFTQKMKSILGGKRHQIGEQIEGVKKRVLDLAARRDRYGNQDLDSHFVTFSRSDLVFPNI
jgi:disease resistance protein RPM1